MSIESRRESSPMVRRERSVALAPRISDADRAAHRQFVASLGETAVWRGYL